MKKEAEVFLNNHRAAAPSINKPALASLAFTASGLLSKGLALIFTPIFTRLLSPSDYGAYSLFTSYLSVLLVLGSLELSAGVLVRVIQKSRKTTCLTLLSASLLTALSSSLVCLAFIIIRRITGGGELFPYSDLFLFIMCISNGIINLYLAKSRFLYKWKSVLTASLIQSLIIPLSSIAALNLRSLSPWNHVTVKIGIASIIMLAAAIFFLIAITFGAIRELRSEKIFGKAALRPALRSVRDLLKLSAPLLPYYLSIMLISQLSRGFISEHFGNEAVAVYSVAYSLGISMNAVSSGVLGSLCPWIMRKIRAEEYGKISKTLDALLKISALAIGVFLAFSRELLSVVAPPSYVSGLPIVLIISLCPLPLSLISVMSSAAIAGERVGGVVLSGVIPALLLLLSNLLFSASGGITLYAALTLGAYILVYILQSVNIRRIFGRAMISEIGVFSSLLLLFAEGVLIYILKDLFLPRLLIASAYAIALGIILKRSSWILKEYKKQ